MKRHDDKNGMILFLLVSLLSFSFRTNEEINYENTGRLSICVVSIWN